MDFTSCKLFLPCLIIGGKKMSEEEKNTEEEKKIAKTKGDPEVELF